MPACPPDCPAPQDARHLGRQPRANPIPAENLLAGNKDWRKGRSASEGELDAYVTADVVEAGDTLSVRISSSERGSVALAAYRIGHYGGAGARKVAELGTVEVGPQPACMLDPSLGLVECPWSDARTFVIGSDWVSGLYLVRVTRADRTFRFAPFVVRDRRAAELYLVSGVQTAQAYNRWGGVSLYGDSTGRVPRGRAHLVSHDRPFRESDGAGQVLRWEAHLARFLEAQGYDVTYGTGAEFARFEDALVGIGMVVGGGHDEYWTLSQREQLDRALAEGRASLAYLGANGGYWRVRLEPAPDGRPLRRVACFKNDPHLDPQPGSTARFRDEPDARPENALFGSWYRGYQVGGVPLVVADAASWTLEGTGLANGDVLPGLLGYEFDVVGDNGLTPPGTHVVMDSPTITTTGLAATSQLVERVLGSGRVVFSAGSIYFPLALSPDPGLRDDRIARMVLNVVERGLSHRRAARALPPAGSSRPRPPAIVGAWASGVSVYAGAAAEFRGPTGLALLPTGELAVADTGNDRIRLVSADGAGVATIAGDGKPGGRDGAGELARFRQPTGVAAMPDGSLLVADQLNHAIRRLVQDGGGWRAETYAGAMLEAATVDGDAAAARFDRPASVATDSQGNAYVADQGSCAIRRIDAATRRVTTLAGSNGVGDADAAVGTDARFLEPSAIAWTPSGLYVVDAGNARIRRVSLDPPHAVTTIAGTTAGLDDGDGTAARFRAQLGLAADATGRLFVADTGNHRLRSVVPGGSAEGTSVRTVAGTGRTGTALGTGDATDLVLPAGVAVRPDGALLVTDAHHGRVLLVQP
jgi:sugar lactone lactonase YvrE